MSADGPVERELEAQERSWAEDERLQIREQIADEDRWHVPQANGMYSLEQLKAIVADPLVGASAKQLAIQAAYDNGKLDQALTALTRLRDDVQRQALEP